MDIFNSAINISEHVNPGRLNVPENGFSERPERVPNGVESMALPAGHQNFMKAVNKIRSAELYVSL